VMRTPQEQYCQSDYVALVKIGARVELQANQEFPGRVYYQYTPEQVLRGTAAGLKSVQEANRLWTNDNSAACGVYFEEGKEYVVAGSVGEDGSPHVYLCNYVALLSNLNAAERTGLFGGYKCWTFHFFNLIFQTVLLK